MLRNYIVFMAILQLTVVNTIPNKLSFKTKQWRRNEINDQVGQVDWLKVMPGHPTACKRKANMSAVETEKYKLCLLRGRWDKEVPQDSFSDSARRQYSIENPVFVERVEPRTDKNVDFKDCLNSTRYFIRPFPYECYNYDIEDRVPETTTVEPNATAAVTATRSSEPKSKVEELWWDFWSTIANDFRFTFDFVLWDEVPVKENRFHYLIYYLRQLLMKFSRPSQILTGRAYRKDFTDHETLAIKLIKQYEKHSADIADLDQAIDDMLKSIEKFKSDKITFLNEINQMILTLARNEESKLNLDDKINEIHFQTNAIKMIINKYSDINLNKFYPVIKGMPGFIASPALYGHGPAMQQASNINFPQNYINVTNKIG